MSAFQPNTKNLPAEILHYIFRQTVKKDLCNFALVCKSWVNPARSILYPKVTISTHLQLQKFHQAIECNNHLGLWVKTFTISFDDNIQRENVLNTVYSLLNKFLPNLEQLYTNYLYSFTPLLDALINSQLGRLKIISEPNRKYQSGQVANYVTCTLLMKHRLEQLIISDNIVFADGIGCERIFFNRLYYRLHQFDNLTAIHVRLKTNEIIQVLEHIVKNCRTLREIKCRFKPTDRHGSFNTSFSVNAIKTFTPRPNIKILINDWYDLFDEKTLIYIMHVFPQLERFICKKAMNGNAVVTKITETLLAQLLQYLLKMKSININTLKVDEKAIDRVFENVWRVTSNLGSEEVKINYVEPYEAGRLLIIKSKQKKHTQLYYSQSSGEWNYFRFLKRNGKYLKTIDFYTEQTYENDTPVVLPENVIAHITLYCPHLKHLYFRECEFDSSPLSTITSDKTSSLDKLYFDNCSINAMVLEQFSQLLVEVKSLKINLFWNTATEITMPCTKIDKISLGIQTDGSLYIKLLVLTTNDHHYVRMDIERNQVKSVKSSEEDYEEAVEHKRVYVCCQTKPKFKIWHSHL